MSTIYLNNASLILSFCTELLAAELVVSPPVNADPRLETVEPKLATESPSEELPLVLATLM